MSLSPSLLRQREEVRTNDEEDTDSESEMFEPVSNGVNKGKGDDLTSPFDALLRSSDFVGTRWC